MGAVVGAELKSNSEAGEFNALLPTSQLSLYVDTEGDIDGYVLTVDRHPQGLDGVNALARSIYDRLSAATSWRLEIDLAEETLVRLAIEVVNGSGGPYPRVAERA